MIQSEQGSQRPTLDKLLRVSLQRSLASKAE